MFIGVTSCVANTSALACPFFREERLNLTNPGPWDNWIPGVLHRNQIKELHKRDLISKDGSGGLDIGVCSIDLSLSEQVYKMKKGSIKPSRTYRYSEILKESDFAEILTDCDASGSYRLEKQTTYVIKLQEKLNTSLGTAGIHGQATAKSSVGRVDVLARLIVDGMDKYECFEPKLLQEATGDLYIEVTPITFDVRVLPTKSISQLRLFYGPPGDAEIGGKHLFKTILGPDAEDNSLSVDLSGEPIDGKPAIAYRTRTPVPKTPVPLWNMEPKPNHREYWETVDPRADERMQIEKSKFYILKSKEKLRVPEGVAIYCKAIDETIGEMRIHYAGFVHPFFGVDRKDSERGTPLIFEVRGHQVDANIAHGEKLAILTFYRMSQDCKEEDKESEDTSYNNQSLQLSKFFS